MHPTRPSYHASAASLNAVALTPHPSHTPGALAPRHDAPAQVLPPPEAAAFLAPLPVRVLPGVGFRTEQQLHAAGVQTVRQLRALPLRPDLERLLGERVAAALHELARGRDASPVTPEEPPKYITQVRRLLPSVCVLLVIWRSTSASPRCAVLSVCFACASLRACDGASRLRKRRRHQLAGPQRGA